MAKPRAKREPIYKLKKVQHTENGVTKIDYVKEKVKPSEIKQTIMRANDWTEDQYKKQYDIFKNKLRAYESYRKAHGAEVKDQSPLAVLYKQAKAKIREGAEYQPSLEMKRIQSFSAVSITKGEKLAANKDSEYSRRRGETFAATTSQAFEGFIRDVPKAKEIDETIEDPVKKEEALKALAEHIHAKQKPTGEVMSGEAVGSDPAGEDFDYSEWLDE